MQIEWRLKKFENLTPYELYAILQLRIEAFVVEQHCVFQDADDKDQESNHLMGWNENKLVAYIRLVPTGHIYEQASIGRVVTSTTVRRYGAGKQLMQESINAVYQLFGNGPIKI